MAEKKNPEEPKIRGVQRIDAPPSQPTEEPASEESNENMVQQIYHTVTHKVSSGWHSACSSWFGLKPVGHKISNAVGKTADFLNVSKKGLSIALGATLAVTGSLGAATLINHREMNVIIRQEEIDECGAILAHREALQLEETEEEDWKAAQMECAKKIWAVCKAIGMTDEQAAGVLGNMQQEGGVDPTSLEGTYSERQHIGPIKAAALPKGTTGRYTKISVAAGQSVKDSYKPYTTLGSGASDWYDPVTQDGLFAYMGTHSGSDFSGPGTCGLGLIQWSFGRGVNLLIFADCAGHNWWDLDMQLAFLIGFDEPGTIQKYIGLHHTSVAEAARSWHQLVERNASAFEEGGSDPRIEKAEKWYAAFSPQSALIQTQYESFVNSVLEMADITASVAAGASDKDDKCDTGDGEDDGPDNSDLAHAAVAYAWETVEMGVMNNGTDLYIAVHDAMFPGDGLYMSCDRGVATAVHWSGADDNFPRGGAGTCGYYMRSHPDKWQEVFDVSEGFRGQWDQLLPGDIFVVFGNEMQQRTGLPRDNFSDHIAMYVSVEVVREKYPDSNCEFVSASYQHRSPGCQDGGSGRDGASTRLKSYWEGHSAFNNNTPYHVFRYVGQWDGQDKYKYTGNASGF